MTYYVLCFIHLGSRKVEIAGMTPHPNEAWMVQVARNVTMEECLSRLILFGEASLRHALTQYVHRIGKCIFPISEALVNQG